MTYFNDTYFEDHLYLLELSTFLEPKSQYSFDYTFQSIDNELADYELWDTFSDGPIPTPYQEGDHEPWNWYTQYLRNCVYNHKNAEFTEDELQDLCDYYFTDNENIYTGDFLDCYKTMTTASDFNLLRLEAPRYLLQITNGTPRPEQAVEIANPAVWVRTLVHQQRQAESDLQRLTELCGDAYKRTDRRTQEIEQAYQTLAEGTRYVYDRVNANEKIAEEWIRSELSKAANAYQSLARNVWQAIIEQTNEAN